jgi:hypothetical protein
VDSPTVTASSRQAASPICRRATATVARAESRAPRWCREVWGAASRASAGCGRVSRVARTATAACRPDVRWTSLERSRTVVRAASTARALRGSTRSRAWRGRAKSGRASRGARTATGRLRRGVRRGCWTTRTTAARVAAPAARCQTWSAVAARTATVRFLRASPGGRTATGTLRPAASDESIPRRTAEGVGASATTRAGPHRWLACVAWRRTRTSVCAPSPRAPRRSVAMGGRRCVARLWTRDARRRCRYAAIGFGRGPPGSATTVLRLRRPCKRRPAAWWVGRARRWWRRGRAKTVRRVWRVRRTVARSTRRRGA